VNALKKGTFICEYVGEIVTNQELYERNNERAAKKERHTYPVLLDADWGSERILEDEEALCLDATEFGILAGLSITGTSIALLTLSYLAST
jgi:hypothetical protein